MLVLTPVTAAQSDEENVMPDAVPLVETDYDVVNILLLGSDTTNPNNAGRTDVMLIVSVNRTAGTVSMLSLPRDLYVYIPGWQMHRLNTAYGRGESTNGEGGGGQLLRETIRYNLGIEIDYYARVDFNGFQQIIDSLGGIEMSVDCAIQDWRLREPGLDLHDADNWEIFTLPVGVHRMDGDLALWYVRSRRTSSDFDRGRRQQDMIRALWRHINQLGLLNQLPEIWQQVTEMVRTDMTLPDVLGMSPLALTLDASRITSHTFRLNVEVKHGYSPEGSSVLFLQPEAVRQLMRDLLTPSTENQIARDRVTVEIVNGSGISGLSRVAADRLAWEGFTPVLVAEPAAYREYTAIYDYTGRTKGSSLGKLQSVLRVGEQGVFQEPDADRIYDYRVVIGNTYYACTHDVLPPRDFSDDS